MVRSCPECSTPSVEGHRFCGGCGALLRPAAPEETVAPAPAAVGGGRATDRDAPARGEPLPGWLLEVRREQEAQVVEATPDDHVEDVAASGPAPSSGWRQRLEARPAWVLAAAIVVALAGLSQTVQVPTPTANGPAAPPAAGNGNLVDVDLPVPTGATGWRVEGALREDVLGPFPWAAPVVEPDRITTVVRGGVVLHDRRDGGVRRVDVPTTGNSGAAVLGHDVIVVAAAGDLWFLDEGGVIVRTQIGDIADVSPVSLETAVLAQTELGALVRVELVDGEPTSRTLRGIDVPQDRNPRFSLGIHAPAGPGFWVGSRDRGSGDSVLWLLRADTLDPVVDVALGTSDTPSVAAVGDGSVVVAVDDRVLHLDADGSLRWEAVVGAGAEVLGVTGNRALVRHDTGRVVFEVDRAAVVARATTALLDGARSEQAGGEVLVLDRDQVVALRVADATVSRRLQGRPLSVAGHDESTIAWVALAADGAPVLRLQPTPDRQAGALDAMDLPLPVARACQIAGSGDRIAWHDGRDLREVRLVEGTVRSRVAAGSSSASTIAVDDQGRPHVVDSRGVVRRFDRNLVDFTVMGIGDDPIGGVAVDGDAVVAAGGTGRIAVVGASDGYVRSLRPDGATSWLVRIGAAVAGPPAARAGTAAVRQVDGGITLLRDGLLVAEVAADASSLDAPVLDAAGMVFRDGDDVVAVFPQGEEAWRQVDVAPQGGLTVGEDLVVVRGVDRLAALDRRTGSVLWEVDVVDGAGVATSPLDRPVLAGDQLVVAVHDGVVVLEAATGAESGRRDAPDVLAGPLVASGAGAVACLADGAIALLP